MIVRSRRAFTALVMALVIVSGVSRCVIPTTAPHTSAYKKSATVVQHTANLPLAPGQTAAATASCASGETLVSGGFSTPDPLPASTQGVVASYPSNSAGSSPTAQGQAVNSWTVRVSNASSASVDYVVSVNCLNNFGTSLASRVWYQPLKLDYPQESQSSDGFYVTHVNCPDAASILTGGGYDIHPLGSVAPTALLAPYFGLWFSSGWADWDGVRWEVAGLNSTGTDYAVCVAGSGIYWDTSIYADGTSFTKIADGQYRSDVSVACPQGDLLVGGGFSELEYPSVGYPLTISELAPGSPAQWHVGYNNTGAQNLTPRKDQIGASAICIGLTPSPRARITFSNYHHLLRIPADSVVVATDGSGQVKASRITVRVSQARSRAIPATKTINPFTGGVSYIVPSGCGSPAPAMDAATTALKDQLKSARLPAGHVAFGSPTITINRGSLTCSPVAGTTHTAPFTYTQSIDGSATQATYNPLDVVSYQQGQLQRAAQQLGSPYALRDTLICPQGPRLLSASSTRASVQCMAYGVAEWPWSTEALQALAQSLAGKSKAEALALLNGTPGIEPGSAVIAHLQGDTLPDNANNLIIIVVRPQDTAPVLRAP